jgi:diguanylate cyclase (GGDEF)-like protein
MQISINKFIEFEKVFIKITAFFIMFNFVYKLIINSFFDVKSNFNTLNSSFYLTTIQLVIFFTILFVLNLWKNQLLINGYFNNDTSYYILKIIEITLYFLLIIIINTGEWGFTIVAITIFTSTLSRGGKYGIILSIWSLFICIAIYYLGYFLPRETYYTQFEYMYKIFTNIAPTIIFQIVITFVFSLFGNTLFSNIRQGEIENKNLVKEVNEKYDQLSNAQNEVKNQYEKLREANIKLEETNERLTNSISEFYTLQQISQAINSIFDIKELLRYVNDVVLGVLGVSNSTVILYDERKNKLKVSTTSIKNSTELVSLSDNVNSIVLMDVLDSGKIFVENFVDYDDFPFTRGRDVKSILCMPFNTRTKRYGLLLIEHKVVNAFDNENMNFLNTISIQLGIALENAELYQKLQSMATTDGLTGIYNRMYLHEKLKEELMRAQELNYPLTLAIFDIDHFKKFNDTYGHLFGDKVLKSIADVVNGALRSSDILARFGGEEFIIILPRTSVLEAYQKIYNLSIKISRSVISDNLVSASVTASFGIAGYPHHASSDNEIIRFADDALYEAKKAGRNCVMVAVHKSELEVDRANQ